jgi:two-component system NtrC family sensor kinase
LRKIEEYDNFNIDKEKLLVMLKKRLADLWVILHSIGFKLFLLLFLLLIMLFGLYGMLYSVKLTQIYEITIGQSAYRNSDLIKKSLYRLMLNNQRDELYKTILMFQDEPGVEAIRIYNKKGEIKFSSDTSETGHIVDMKAEACYACHAADKPIESLPTKKKIRIYRATEGKRIMGLINPIRNAPECSNNPCHAHQPDLTILGVLDVQMSLNELDMVLSETRFTVYAITIGIVGLSMILFAVVVYLFIYRPISTLKTGTVRLAIGDLDYRINMQRRDEFGMLARSFNNMGENLKRAYNELKQWSYRLAERVNEKTIELEEIHKSILQVEKMTSLGKMAASVAHELNNPLAGIVTYAKVLEKKVKSNVPTGDRQDSIIKDLELIRSESLRCGNIVRNLLAFARGKSANFQETQLDDIINRSLDIMHHHMMLAKVEVEKEISLTNNKIFCDPDQLMQALIALLVNAVEAMPQGGQLRISAEDSENEPEQIIIKIQDSGVGISEEVVDKIFEPFFTTKKDQKGVGLGLPVVYGIIQRHRGKIWVKSKVNEGTTFFIQLPTRLDKLENQDIEGIEL